MKENERKTGVRDLISRNAALTAIQKAYRDSNGGEIKRALYENGGLTRAINIIQDLLPAEPRGKWVEFSVYDCSDSGVEELQTCRCSNCGRYDTRPFLYYVNEPRFCSFCGSYNGREGNKHERPYQ